MASHNDTSLKIVNDYYDLIREHRTTGNIKNQVYTPIEIVEHIVNSTIPKAIKEFQKKKQPLQDMNILDPCCGSGIFLLYAVRKVHELTGIPKKDIIENNIHGIDIDLGAVNATKRMLQNEAKTKCNFQIYWGDFLCDFFLKADHLSHITNLVEVDKLNKYLEDGRTIFLEEYNKHVKNPDPHYARSKAIHKIQQARYNWNWNAPKWNQEDVS